MKRTLVVPVTICLLLGACATAPVTDGPLISVETVEPASVAEESSAEDPKTAEIAKPIAPKYRTLRVQSYLSNGVLDTITEFIYDGDLLVEEREQYQDGTLIGLVRYDYDGGRLAKRTKMDGSGRALSAHSFRYNGDGYLIRDSLLDTQDNPIFSYAYEYGEDGNRALFKIYASDDLLLSYARYQYEGGRNVRIENYSTLDVLQEYLVRTFDQNGSPILEVMSDTGGIELEKKRYEYSAGLLASKETFVRTRKAGSETYEYDKAGNLATRKRFDRTGKVVETNEYTYIEVEQK